MDAPPKRTNKQRTLTNCASTVLSQCVARVCYLHLQHAFVLKKLKSSNFLKAIANIKNQDPFHLFSTLGRPTDRDFLFRLLRSKVTHRGILRKL